VLTIVPVISVPANVVDVPVPLVTVPVVAVIPVAVNSVLNEVVLVSLPVT